MSPNSTGNAVIAIDQRIAAVLQSARQEMVARLREGGCPGEDGGTGRGEDLDQVLQVLSQAFQHGRWGTYYCLFQDPMDAARCLSQVGTALLPHLLREADAHELVSRLLQVVGEMALVVSDAERASAAREAEALKDLSEIKSAFLRLTTHELRRPLGVTRGHLSLLQEGTYGEVPEVMRQPLQQIAAGAREMASLVDGLATVSRLEDRADVLQRAPCRVGVLVSDAVRAVEPEAALRRVRIEQRLPSHDLQIVADGDRLRIAVLNLLTNAIKYAPAETTVTVQAAERQREVAIAVADEGPGIDPSEGERVFEMHYRSQRLPGHTPGLGLGLYIVRQIVELHGGRVTLQSAPGQGSIFAILLPSD